MTGDPQAWGRHPSAPPVGTVLTPLDAVPDGGVREVRFGEGRRVFSMLVVRRGRGVRAYVNACPHVWLPLTYRSTAVLSADGARLVCSNHLAEFSVEDGCPLSGPVPEGGALDPVPVHVDGAGQIVVGDDPIHSKG